MQNCDMRITPMGAYSMRGYHMRGCSTREYPEGGGWPCGQLALWITSMLVHHTDAVRSGHSGKARRSIRKVTLKLKLRNRDQQGEGKNKEGEAQHKSYLMR